MVIMASLPNKSLVVLGLNHRTAALAMREQLAISPAELPLALQQLRDAASPLEEVVVLSTCNRVECYAVAPDATAAYRHLEEFLIRRANLPERALGACLYRLDGAEAVRHLFRVAAGLDSMVLGESEITAQVKQAYLSALGLGASGPMLNRLFQKALHSTKILRSQTRIADGHASVGSVVVRLSQELFGDGLSGCGVLLWGAGKAAETTARHLIKHGVKRVWVVNRTAAKAQELARQCAGGWLSWEQALTHLAHVDIAIVCTQAPHYVVEMTDLEAVWPARQGRALLLIDLAVPRNVDPSIRRHPGVRLYDLDDLQAVAGAGLEQRRRELGHCETVIQEQLGHFVGWCHRGSYKEARACQGVGV